MAPRCRELRGAVPYTCLTAWGPPRMLVLWQWAGEEEMGPEGRRRLEI